MIFVIFLKKHFLSMECCNLFSKLDFAMMRKKEAKLHESISI